MLPELSQLRSDEQDNHHQGSKRMIDEYQLKLYTGGLPYSIAKGVYHYHEL